MEEWSKHELTEKLAEQETVFLYLYTPLCGTCQLAGKMLSVVDEMLPETVIAKADMNYLSDWAEQWKVESVPCLLTFKKGQPSGKIYAFHSVPYLLDYMNNSR